MHQLAPEDVHFPLIDTAPCRLAFDPTRDFAAWRTEVDERLHAMIGVLPDRCDLEIAIVAERDFAEYHEIEFTFLAESNARVPAHLLLPPVGNTPYPVVIALQGHTSGMHISLGRALYPGDAASIAEDRDYALQAVRMGFAALVLEQRAFGVRKDQRPEEFRHGVERPCHHAMLTALLLGRTLLGERVWDVMRAVDAMQNFPAVDVTRIVTVGDSTGGTIAYFAACLDPRISATIPAAYVCSARYSLGRHDHCEDHYLPGMLNFFDIGDLAGLIAPRPLIVVAGKNDIAFPLAGVEHAYATIEQIYAAAEAPHHCRLIVGDGGHRFYADPAWSAFRELCHWT
ncbi:MAG: acetylxylan esterase [Anaerolineae bacterium]|nr:acetylxylan esterase [Anaerolineae bacterium]